MNKTRWADVTEAELAASGKVRRGTVQASTSATSKYRNVKTIADGVKFDSRREANYWMGLKAREAAGEISDLHRQVKFPLYVPEMDRGGHAQFGNIVECAVYIADFTWIENGRMIAADAKGMSTQVYKLKAKWLLLQQGLEIREV